MNCRQIDKLDLPLFKDILSNLGMDFTTVTLEDFLNNPNNAAFISDIEDKAVGLAYGSIIYHPNGDKDFFLYSLDVLLEYRNKGYATELINYIKEWSNRNGIREILLISEKDNRVACHLYEKAGGHSLCNCDEICYTIDTSYSS